jgi:hypothetical protein
MVKWPFSKQKKQSFIDEPLEKQLRMEAGLTAIKGTEYTKLRIENSDEGITEFINLKIQQLNRLEKKTSMSEQEEEKVNRLLKEIRLWIFYRQFKRASAPWATAGEDHDMSVRLRATEIFFFRNVDKSDIWNMVMMVLQYVSDLCYKEWHVAPAPTVLIQSFPQLGSRVGLGDLSKTKTEEISSA